MRVAVISDVHGNLHALDAVLASIDAEKPDALWCLGDLVGYGPEPNRCAAVVGERAALCLAGNHDLAALGQVAIEEFSPDAAASAAWTRRMLTDETTAFLKTLSPEGERDGVALFHGSPRDPVWDYVLTVEAVKATFEGTNAGVVLVGHSHVALAVCDDMTGGQAGDGEELSLDQGRWILNPGSVGQPRDGDPRAAWLLLDLGGRTATFHRVEYPIARTQAEIREAGLPWALAERLAHGA